jgi:hypothetical protein
VCGGYHTAKRVWYVAGLFINDLEKSARKSVAHLKSNVNSNSWEKMNYWFLAGFRSETVYEHPLLLAAKTTFVYKRVA